MKLYFTVICCFLFIVNATSQTVKEIQAKDAFELVVSRDTANTILIDGRSFEMFAEKHIAGAINIDAFQDSITLDLKSFLKVKEIIVYCSNRKRAELIVEKLKELNYSGDIVFISDGINGWIAAGFEIVEK
ncbi:MAG: rhodanese-like domain-containing protein [Bacteroidales bacterium]|nr:rhodanese-like domain-containing protein [Bacteroidales bacterium]MDY0216404.1 rhodanese-like domain-containing protein [Bacteroidales bacterium]